VKSSIHIGGASGYWGESAMATPQLLSCKKLDYLVYDYLAEITMSIMAQANAKDASRGYATDFIDHVLKPNIEEIAKNNIIATCRDLIVQTDGTVRLIKETTDLYGKTATFMPKPIVGDNGSGMHCHQSLAKDGVNLFAGDKYGGLSEEALYYIGGIIKHAKAINAFANASTNSYKRLVPGFEAPVMLAYSARNRSASIRIPVVPSEKGRRIEVRFPDPTANPYLAFSAMLMAGLDGIKNKIHPGDAMDKDLYDLPAEEAAEIPTVATSLQEALASLDADREFLNQGGVFTNDLIDAYIALKSKEVEKLNMTTHPVEFEMYYSC